MNAVTLVGDPVVVTLIATYGSLTAYRLGFKEASWALLATIIASGLNGILKQFTRRTRPNTLYVKRMRFKTYSFPSGHAFGAMLTYSLLTYFAIQKLALPFSLILSCLFGLLIVLVGVSRVYLGAHYPSDVLVGWLIGAISLVLIWFYILI